MQLIIDIDDSETELLPYYAQVVGVDLSKISNPSEQVNSIADVLRRKYRLQAIELKAKTEADATASQVREQYSSH